MKLPALTAPFLGNRVDFLTEFTALVDRRMHKFDKTSGSRPGPALSAYSLSFLRAMRSGRLLAVISFD